MAIEHPDETLKASPIPNHRHADWTESPPKTCLSCEHFTRPDHSPWPRCGLWEARWNAERQDAGHEVAVTHRALVCDEWEAKE